MDPKRADRLCQSPGAQISDKYPGQIDLVASPAMGGVVVGYEMGRQLGVPAIFFERVDGKLVLRRGFTIAKGARVLMVEDIVTTGLSSRECIAGIAEEGGVTHCRRLPDRPLRRQGRFGRAAVCADQP